MEQSVPGRSGKYGFSCAESESERERQFLREAVSALELDDAVLPDKEDVDSILLGSRKTMRAASRKATTIQKARTP